MTLHDLLTTPIGLLSPSEWFALLTGLGFTFWIGWATGQMHGYSRGHSDGASLIKRLNQLPE